MIRNGSLKGKQMLKGAVKRRPRQLVAVYVEPHRIEILRARRHWRSWEIGDTESYSLPEGESVHDFLHRLNIKAAEAKNTALILFLARCYYTFHREYYPSSIQDRLEDTLAFDWEENLFHEHEHTVCFFGPPVPLTGSIAVPIFSLHSDAYDKFYQVLGGGTFQTFTVMPDALVFRALLPSLFNEETSSSPIEILGRATDTEHLEIHRFYNGALLDSVIVGKDLDTLPLFRENLHCLAEDESSEQVRIQLFYTDNEISSGARLQGEWADLRLPIEVRCLEGPFVSAWVKYLLTQDQVRTFDTQLILKPWKVPRIVWPIAAAVVLFACLGLYQAWAVRTCKETSLHVKKQVLQLETQWKPIEQLQTRISKFQEDQKTLTQFNMEGYPLLEVLTLLSQTTPDDTWLNYFSLRKGQVVIRGESKSAIKYLSELSKVDGLADVRFASPVTKNPVSDQERFNVQVQLDLDKLKKTFESMEFEREPEREELKDEEAKEEKEVKGVQEEKGEQKEAPVVAAPAPSEPDQEEEVTEEEVTEEEAPTEEESVEETVEEGSEESEEVEEAPTEESAETNADGSGEGE